MLIKQWAQVRGCGAPEEAPHGMNGSAAKAQGGSGEQTPGSALPFTARSVPQAQVLMVPPECISGEV